MNTVAAPTSLEAAPRQVRWSAMREISLMITRAYWQRSGVAMPSNFSAASAKPTLLISGEA